MSPGWFIAIALALAMIGVGQWLDADTDTMLLIFGLLYATINNIRVDLLERKITRQRLGTDR